MATVRTEFHVSKLRTCQQIQYVGPCNRKFISRGHVSSLQVWHVLGPDVLINGLEVAEKTCSMLQTSRPSVSHGLCCQRVSYETRDRCGEKDAKVRIHVS